MSTFRHALLGAAALACLTSVARAEDTADTQVSSVIVTARPNPEDPPVVADARKRLSETPGAVSVISQESYINREALALDDMLRDAPGVYAQRKWGGDIRISIRGSGIGNASHNRGLLLAQDGVPLNEADGYGDSQIADPLNTRYAEVYRGGNALRFGGALLGGAINMVTPTGKDAGFANQVRLDGGSFGLVREHVALARQSGDGAATGTSSPPPPTRRPGLALAEPAEHPVRLAEHRPVVRPGPRGAVHRQRVEHQPGDPRLPDPGPVRGRSAPVGGRQPRQRPGPQPARPARLAGDHLAAERQPGVPGRGLCACGRTWTTRSSRSSTSRAATTAPSAGSTGTARSAASGPTPSSAPGTGPATWTPTSTSTIAGRAGAPTSRTLQNAKAVDVFGEGRLFVTDRVAMVTGATWGQAQRDYTSFAVPGVASTFNLKADKTYNWVSPRVGLLWQDEAGDQVFANLTRSVEPPNFSSMSPTNTGFAPVRAQKAWTGEIGARGRKGPFTYDLTLYRAQLKDEMLQYAVTSSIPASTFNADKTVHQGIEAALDWAVAPRWRIRQTWTLSDFRFKDDVQFRDNRLPIVPKSFYRAEVRYDDPRGWFVAPSIEWSTSDRGSTTPTPRPRRAMRSST
jgi:iron complex outermembrane receptor protein